MQKFDIITENRLQKPTSWSGNAHAHLLNESNDKHDTLKGAISGKQRIPYIQLIIATSTVIMGAVGITAMFQMGETYQMLTKKQTDPESFIVIDENKIEGKISADQISKIENQICHTDKLGRYIIEADITNTSENPYSIRIKTNTTLEGTDTNNEKYNYTVQNTKCDCATENTYFDGTKVVIYNLTPNETRHIVMYPNFSDTKITNANITSLTNVELALDYATKPDENIPNLKDTTFSYNLSEDGKSMEIHAKTKEAKEDVPDTCFEAILIDKFGNPFGYQYAENITFPFGLVTVKGTIAAHKQGYRGYGTIKTDTGDTAARGIVTSIHT